MKRIVASVVVAAGILAANASAGTSKPGAGYFVSETAATSFLEGTFPYARCTGIPRLGHRGAYPDDKFVYFDCDIHGSRYACVHVLEKAIKGSSFGSFRLVVVFDGDCS